MSIVNLQIDGTIAYISLARTDKRNAINTQLQNELIHSLISIEGETVVSTVLIRSVGEHFSVGADIHELASMDRSAAIAFRERMSKIASIIHNSDKIFIFYLTGFSLGGGLEIAQWGDMIIAKSDARIGQPEIKIGINAGAGGNSLLPLSIGYRNAMYMALTGRILDPRTALAIGLIQDIVENDHELEEKVKLISSMDLKTMRAIKRVMRSTVDITPSELMNYEQSEFAELVTENSTKKLLSQFLHKE